MPNMVSVMDSGFQMKTVLWIVISKHYSTRSLPPLAARIRFKTTKNFSVGIFGLMLV